MGGFDGFLFSKLQWIHTKSEGSAYYLQQLDYNEIPIAKRALLQADDALLRLHLGSKVSLTGELVSGVLHYETIRPWDPDRAAREAEPALRIDLELQSEVIWVNRFPPVPPSPLPRPFRLTVKVEWLDRGIWKGLCPTSQLYDFIVERDGEILWQWSRDRFFSQVVTPLQIPGGASLSFSETWVIDPETLLSEGDYVARAIFIASGQEVERKFSIRSAR